MICMKRRAGVVVALLMGFTSATAQAQQKGGEVLLMPFAVGYVQGFKNTAANGAGIIEYVPQGETVQEWTEMLTVNTAPGVNASPRQYLGVVESGWKAACPDAGAHWIRDQEEDGYPMGLLMLTCANNPSTGKPEITWLKGIQGKEAFYVVQKAFRFDPSKEQVVQWVGFLRDVRLCNEQGEANPCPREAPGK